jgi:predicted glycosyl hydrolase (DUF1957 family)
MLNWINFLHIYQPPTQDQKILDQVLHESYLLIIDLLKKYPNLKITLNISGSLLEKLHHNRQNTFINQLKPFVKKGRVELVGSAMYHPILPLIPEKEIIRQIQLNEKIGREVFGTLYKPQGFFIPEMAYSKKVADSIKKAGYKWIILDEIHSNKALDNKVKYKIKNNGLIVIFRDRRFSKSFPPESLIKNLTQIKNEYIITAHDGEMYGHWHKDDRNYYKKAFTHPEIKMITASEYLSKLKKTRYIEVRKASWESTKEELQKNLPYALWNDPQKMVHKLLWKLENFAMKTVEKNKKDVGYKWARIHLDRGLASCIWWWASERKPDALSPITWHPSEIEKGAQELLNSVRSLKSIHVASRLQAEKLFNNLKELIWKIHWKKYVVK